MSLNYNKSYVAPCSPYASDQLHAITRALEHYSEHPLAQPLRQLTTTKCQVSQVETITGAGLQGIWQNQSVRLGSLAFIQQWHPEYQPHLPQAQVFLASVAGVWAEYQVGDQLRSDAQIGVARLQQAGFKVVMLTGDRLELAQPIAQQLGITEVQANCLPADKLAYVSEAQQQHPVMMIGDGINDGPVLAQADISVTFGHAADLARTAADVVLMRNQFSAVLSFVDIAAKSRTILRQNIIWALVYNVGILPVAMFGLVTPTSPPLVCRLARLLCCLIH